MLYQDPTAAAPPTPPNVATTTTPTEEPTAAPTRTPTAPPTAVPTRTPTIKKTDAPADAGARERLGGADCIKSAWDGKTLCTAGGVCPASASHSDVCLGMSIDMYL